MQQTLPTIGRALIEQRCADAEKNDSDDDAFDEMEIALVTKYADSHSAARAVRWWGTNNSKKCTKRSVQRWLKHFRATGAHFVPQKRGRHPVLTAKDDAELLQACRKWRDAKKSLCGADFVSFAKGIIKKDANREKLLHENGGPFVLSDSWARSWLSNNGFTVRSATTDRTVQDSEVVRAGMAFFKEIAETRATISNRQKVFHPKFTINMDEFFVCLETAPTRAWTWHRVVPGTPIAIGKTKLGFTCSIAVSAAGEVVLMQMIWKGATSTVHADFEQFSVTGRTVIFKIQKRTSSGLPNWQRKSRLLSWTKPRSIKGGVPKKMTHIFQPCDQYVIANIRQMTNQAWREHVVHTIASAETIEKAVETLLMNSAPVVRQHKARFLCAAMDAISMNPLRRFPICRGWYSRIPFGVCPFAQRRSSGGRGFFGKRQEVAQRDATSLR